MHEKLIFPPINALSELLAIGLRPYDARRDALPSQRVEEVVANLESRRLAQRVNAEFNFAKFYESNIEQRDSVCGFDLTPVVLEKLTQVPRSGFHATNLLAWNMFLKGGCWLVKGTLNHGFFSVTTINDESASTHREDITNYFASGPFTRRHFERCGIDLTESEVELSRVGIIVGVDFHGFRAFKHSSDYRTLDYRENTLWALCPPPPRFLKPLGVVTTEIRDDHLNLTEFLF